MKKVILMSLIVTTMFFNAGCDEGDIAAGVIGVGVGVGVGAIVGGSAGYNNGYHDGRHDGYHDGRHDSRHRRGRYVRPDRYRNCGYYRCYNSSLNLEIPALTSTDAEVLNFALKYNISNEASAKIQTAFVDVETKGIASFESIGLNKKDLTRIARRQLPDTDSLKSLAQKLDLSEAQSRDLVKSMITEFNQQATNVESPYWQSCIAKGKWKTPENTNCSKTTWTGCSPATGASLCY